MEVVQLGNGCDGKWSLSFDFVDAEPAQPHQEEREVGTGVGPGGHLAHTRCCAQRMQLEGRRGGKETWAPTKKHRVRNGTLKWLCASLAPSLSPPAFDLIPRPSM